MEKENLHAGHRKRKIENFLKNPDGLSEHELLEVLLFSVVPRKDTNELAHILIRAFGGLKGVFSASPSELTAVDGVGEKIASHIAVFGKIMNCVYANADEKKEKIKFSSFASVKTGIKEYFQGLTIEKFMLVFLDKAYKEIFSLSYDGDSDEYVSANVQEISMAIVINKPTFIVLAHNHPSGEILPSDADDYATRKMNVICEMNGVQLIDHIIYSENEVFSYYKNGRLDRIKSTANLAEVFESFKKIGQD